MTTPSTSSTSPDEVYTPFQPAFVSDTAIQISGNDMGYLVPWMRAQLATQPKHDNNSDLCQALSSILRQASKVYGSEPGDRETCICYG
jgi:hypothetical protein